jgi:hypothetical protein
MPVLDLEQEMPDEKLIPPGRTKLGWGLVGRDRVLDWVHVRVAATHHDPIEELLAPQAEPEGGV